MMNTMQQETDLWEVWIEYDQFHPENFGTLYVHGEILAAKDTGSSMIKIDSSNQKQLRLQLPAPDSGLNYMKEVVYSEPIKNLDQYSSVCIYFGDELIDCFSDIEIMI